MERDETAPGGRAHEVAGAPDPLQGAGDAARARDLHDGLHLPDVDPQLEGAGGHEGLQPARLQVALDLLTGGAGDRTVVRGHLGAQPLLEQCGHTLGLAAVVAEDERRLA